jgi:cytoskeletal protein CcmA (bactofilin family)
MTVGKVHVKAGAKVDGVKIIATDIVVAGDCSSADLCPTRQIELDTGAVVAPATLNSSKIVILAGAQVSLSEPLRCNELDIYGALSAKASPGGLVQIHAGGMFRGDLECAHLIIFEGAGLSANLRVSPALAKDKAEHAENVAQNTAGNKKELLSDGEKEAEGKRIVKGAFKEESGKVE